MDWPFYPARLEELAWPLAICLEEAGDPLRLGVVGDRTGNRASHCANRGSTFCVAIARVVADSRAGRAAEGCAAEG